MRQWESEHGKGYDVPSAINYLVDQKVLTDFSWHNDLSPSFAIPSTKNEEYGLRIWVDHPLMSFREAGGKRFILQEGHFGSEHDFELESDELEEILIALFDRVRSDRYSGAAIRKKRWFEVEEGGEYNVGQFIQDWTGERR